MSIDVTVTIMQECHWCGGDGEAMLKTCKECKGSGVSEQQVSLREFRHMLKSDEREERAEMDAGRFVEVKDAE